MVRQLPAGGRVDAVGWGRGRDERGGAGTAGGGARGRVRGVWRECQGGGERRQAEARGTGGGDRTAGGAAGRTAAEAAEGGDGGGAGRGGNAGFGDRACAGVLAGDRGP